MTTPRRRTTKTTRPMTTRPTTSPMERDVLLRDLLDPPEASATGGARGRVELDPEALRGGLSQLVLTLIKLIHDLLEKQALRRMEAGRLDDDQLEAIGTALMRQAEEIERLREQFGLEHDELNLDLGPLGKLL
ncbi:MAG: gas vesicle protein K [Myxococcales bacterium]|nr:gas vesicle protein K [Myxococcales bacterium]